MAQGLLTKTQLMLVWWFSMSKVLVYNDPKTGNLTVVKLSPNAKAPLEHFAPKDGTEWHVIDEADIPTDRAYRNAWQLNEKKVERNPDRAIEIKRQRVREERAPQLAELDVAYMRADEEGNLKLKKEIAKKKQELRDATKNVTLED